MTTEPKEPENQVEQEVSDEALEMASGGSGEGINNSTLIVYASTFIPFDSSF